MAAASKFRNVWPCVSIKTNKLFPFFLEGVPEGWGSGKITQHDNFQQFTIRTTNRTATPETLAKGFDPPAWFHAW